MIEKLGCPFCGKTDGLSMHKFYNAMNWYQVKCSICKASGGARLSETQAVEAWNQRLPSHNKDYAKCSAELAELQRSSNVIDAVAIMAVLKKHFA